MAVFFSTISNLSTSMRVNGAIYRIRFVPRDKPYCNGLFAVSDPSLVAAIRKHPYFGTVITEQSEPSVVPADKPKAYAATYPDVTKSQDAKDILVSKYHAAADALTSKAAIRQAAEALNISFPNL